jgi:hypothetical protein
MSASVESTTTPAAARSAAGTLDAPLRPARLAQLQLQEKVSLTEEGLRRVRSETATAPGQVMRSDADLARLLHERAVGTGPDLSKETVVTPLADPHTSALKSLLWASDLGDEDLGRVNQAIDAATPTTSRVASDPAIELALRKMKLDYIRDTMVPEALRPDAGRAIANFVSGTRLDNDRIATRLAEYAAQQSAASGAPGAGAPSQPHASELLAQVADNRYRTRQEAGDSFERSIAAIESALLAQVASWPRDQERGRAGVYNQVAAIRSDWARFIESVG